jgi:hypothetical protein
MLLSHPRFWWWRQDSNLRPDDYRSSALPLSFATLKKVWLRSLDLNQNIWLQRPASCQLDDSAKCLAAGVRVELTAFVPMRHMSGPHAPSLRLKVWRLVVDSHHSLRLFRPTLELSQLPSRKSSGGWSRTCTGDLALMRRLLCFAELSSHKRNLVGASEDTYILQALDATRAVSFRRSQAPPR